jgi:hypothetical protein
MFTDRIVIQRNGDRRIVHVADVNRYCRRRGFRGIAAVGDKDRQAKSRMEFKIHGGSIGDRQITGVPMDGEGARCVAARNGVCQRL